MNPYLDLQSNPFLAPDPRHLRISALRGQPPQLQSIELQARADELFDEGRAKLNAPVDPSAQIEQMRRNQGMARRNLAIALAAQQAGEEFGGLGGQYLKRSMELRGPIKIGNAGIVDPSGLYVEDPTFVNQQRANTLLQQAQWYEQLAQRAATAEERQRVQAEAAEARARAESLAAESRAAAQEMARGNLAIREAQLELARDQQRAREQAAAEKKAEIENKKQMRLANAEVQAQSVDAAIQAAQQLVGPHTAGFGGLLANLPASSARNLQAYLTTIKANLGFDRLQQMRQESPTGGALGQVAVQELVALQATVASLDQLQNAGQLKQALDKIRAHYRNWLEIMRQVNRVEEDPVVQGPPPGSVRLRGAPAAPAAPQGPPPGAVRLRGGQ